MASDEQQFKRARGNWEALLEAGSFSAPPDVGRIAILCSYHTPRVKIKREADHPNRTKPKVLIPNPNEIRLFRKEAFALAKNATEEGREPELILNAQPADMRDVLRDPSISDVITIGHGSLTAFALHNQDNPHESFDYNWKNAINDADHLKTGKFTQRHCALLTSDLNVPLGMFVLTDPRNVIAPVGEKFEPKGLNHPEKYKLRPALDVARPSYKYIKNTLPYVDPEPPVNYDEVMR